MYSGIIDTLNSIAELLHQLVQNDVIQSTNKGNTIPKSRRHLLLICLFKFIIISSVNHPCENLELDLLRQFFKLQHQVSIEQRV